MSQSFDMKRYEKNKARATRTRNLFSLPYDVTENVMHILTYGAYRSDLFTSCVTCSHFETTELTVPDEHGATTVEKCKLCGLRPPASVIVDGCNKYEDKNDIPF